MCGICGVFNFDGAPVVESTLVRMRSTLTHRGPDDQGEYLDGSIGLASCRLSVIDLETGSQPVWNETRDVCIVFNGEIYNFLDLRKQLIARGHCFRTQSDTEVIVHLYEDRGEDCVTDLDGMFAFAVWDVRQQKLMLARDRLGEKPLVYSVTDRRVIFASEIKALTVCGPSRGIDLEAASHYFTLMSVPAPLTIFQGVKKLMPGHIMTCDRSGSVRIREYWNVTNWSVDPALTEDDRLAKLNDHLESAVRQRLVADVPVGALLSGGLDSSLVVATMKRVSNAPVQTFSVGFEGEDTDELPFAREVARSLGTVHHEVIVKPDVSEVLPRLVWHADEPFAVSSAIPTYFVSKAAREHVTVVLTGDGGDELFAGYPRYLWDRWADRLGAFGSLAGLAFGPMLQAIASRNGGFRRAARNARSLRMAPDQRYTYYLSKIDAREKQTLLSPEVLRAFADLGVPDSAVLDGAYRSFSGSDRLNRRLYGDVKSSLADEMLTKVDRMSMAASVEARPPLLDHHLVEFAATLPSRDKLRGRTTKYLLRRAARAVLPPSIPARAKHGFDVPVGAWMRGALRTFAEDVLFSTKASTRGFWQTEAVRAMWRRHQAGEPGLAERLWVLLNWELWCQVVYDTQASRK